MKTVVTASDRRVRGKHLLVTLALTTVLAFQAAAAETVATEFRSSTSQSRAAGMSEASPGFDELVKCRVTLTDAEWEQKIWPEGNPSEKPQRWEVLPDSAIRTEVLDLLRKESALRAHYRLVLTAEMLQTEIERMVLGTQAPGRLAEKFRVLGNSPEQVANCIARPLLIERRLRESYEFDSRWHGSLRRHAEQALDAGAVARDLEVSGGRETIVIFSVVDEGALLTRQSNSDFRWRTGRSHG